MFYFVRPVSTGAILADLIEILIWLIIVEAVVSNFIAFGKVSSQAPFVKILRTIVNPFLNPVRRMLPPASRTGGFDLSPLLVIILLQVVRGFLGVRG